jgi:hypothetical protein
METETTLPLPSQDGFCAWGDVGSAADKVQEVERQPFGFAVIGAEK